MKEQKVLFTENYKHLEIKMLIGREEEVKKLNELYDSGEAELIALYGRRRVGKTYLIDEVFEKKICFRHAGLSPIDDNEETINKYRMKDQLEHFYRSLVVHGYKGQCGQLKINLRPKAR